MRRRMCDIISVKIEPGTRQQIEKVARQQEVTISNVIRAYIASGLRKDGVEC